MRASDCLHKQLFSCSTDAFAKLWEATICFVVYRMSFCLAVCNSDPIRRSFYVIWRLKLFRKSIQKIHDALKSGRNNQHVTWRPIHIFKSYLPKFFPELEMFQSKVVEKIKTHIFCSIHFFFENRTVCEIMWGKVGQTAEDSKIRRMRFACRIPKATNTHNM